MRTSCLRFSLMFVAMGMLTTALALPPSPPAAATHPVVTDYFGTRVTDPYRWMEGIKNPQRDAWMKTQNVYTRTVLDAIPGRAALLKQIEQADGRGTSVFWLQPAANKFFYMKQLPGQNIPTLDVRNGVDGAERVLVDPNKLTHDGKHYSINYFRPSFDGRYVAYGLSEGGSEKSLLHVVDVQTGKLLAEAIDRVEGDGNFVPVTWRPDDRSFFYYRQQALGPQDPPSAKFLKSRDYLHVLGKHPDGDGDKPAFGYKATPGVEVQPDQDALIVTIPGSAYAFGLLTRNEEINHIEALYAAPLKDVGVKADPWHRIADKPDHIRGFAVHDDRIYLVTYDHAPNYKVVETSIRHPDFASAKVVVPNGKAVITHIAAGRDGLYVQSLLDGMGRVERIAYQDGRKQAVTLPFKGTVSSLVTANGSPGAYLELTSWTHPPTWYRYDSVTGKLTATKLLPASPLDYSGVESREVEAVSYDGTLVPLSIVMPKGAKPDGRNPTLLIGYGSYGITLTPRFLSAYLPWFQHGGILAVAHVRGGGIKGEGWHKAGMKKTKLNTVLDFIACAHYLIDHHYTSPAYLGGRGTSAGGITIGGAITWRPDLFAAAIDNVGLTDALRMETTPNGPPNVVEFGSVKTREGFHDLYTMSAYAHVHDGTPYPAVLLMTGANDPRVAPWIVAKMAARLQAATSSGKPVLLRVDYDAGHGIGSTRLQEDKQLADQFAFLLWQFGEPGFQPKQ